uniref:Uncharacterized protein n=1 Tax=Kalanchoe fedtschenkoi TaxID=63787 RepID=A0A7N0T960_KALFE
MGTDGQSTDSSAGEGVLINVRCSNGTKVAVRAPLESTVGQFKELLAQNCDVPAVQQRLIYKGRILKDDQTLQSYGLQAEHTVHMVRGSAPSGSSSTTSAVNASAGGNVNSAATDPSATPEAGTEGATGGASLGASLFPGADFNFLGRNSNLGAGIPGFDQMHQQLSQNPNFMREIMNTPAVQSLMNNPDLMRTMIMNNPQTREIIDRNPELAHILNDPSIIRQTLETARNPELMREMMRNTDRAMSNIESSPEGFNMLRRMYENVQEPFLNATAGGAGNDTAANPFAALLGNQGGGGAQTGSNVPNNGSDSAGAVPNTNPLPNPWGAPQTNTASRTPSNALRTAGVGGLGGLGLPALDRLSSGGMPDAALMNQLLQNPAMSQMMQSVFSNPQSMNQLLNFNPQMRTLLDSNPQLREMMQNPEFLRQLTSPETMQQMMTLQQSLLPLLNQQQGARGAGQGGDAAGLETLMSMFSGLAPNTHAVPPEELYATQLGQLQEMGFFDTQENIRALQATSGNVHAAVERLLNNLGQ